MRQCRDIPYSRFDKGRIRSQFDRAASTYDDASSLQRSMADQIIHAVGTIDGQRVADLGCGTGYMLRRLEAMAPAWLTGLDISPGMLAASGRHQASVQLVAGDIEQLPFADNSLDCVVSNAALQWCEPGVAAGEIKRVLGTKGRLLASAFGDATLSEWKLSGKNTLAISPLPSVDSLRHAFTVAGFKSVQTKNTRIELRYNTIDEMFSAIRDLGATAAGQDRPRGLMGRQRYAAIRMYFQKELNSKGYLPLTFEPIQITART